MNQISLAGLMMHLNMEKTDKPDVGMVRHMILNSIRMHRQEFNEEYGEIVLAYDSKHYWRRDFFPHYKLNRRKARSKDSKDWESIFECLNKIKQEIKDYLPYKVIEVHGAEADDVIGTLAKKYPDEKIMIVSGDKDMRSTPCILLRNGDLETISEKRADRNWMVQVLCGDRCDNIPGLVGVGPKTAEKILGDSETLSDMWDKVIGAYEKRKLTYKSALLSARLTRILRHGEYNLHKQEVSLWEPPTT